MSLTQINKAGLDEIALDHVFTIGASGSSAYTFQGEGLNGTVNNPTLYLTRGKTYRFENGSGGHPIRIQSTSGASGTAYNTGVTNNAGSGTVIVEVQHDAPDVLYYQCTSHAAMNGILYITGALADGGVTTAKIADDAVTDAKLANSINAAIAANTAKTSNATHTGDVTGSTSLTIANNAVTNGKIVDGAVTTTKIADDAVTSAKIADGTIINGNIAADTIQLTKLQNMATNHILGRSTSGTGNPEILGAAQVRTILNVENGATASSGTTINNNADNRVITGSDTANTLNGESNVIIDSSGRVGIGKTNPAFLLEVKGATASSLRLNNSGETGSGSHDVQIVAGGAHYQNIHVEGSNIFYKTWNGSSVGERFRIRSTGGVTFNGDTADANALDDYEEGTWTPVLQFYNIYTSSWQNVTMDTAGTIQDPKYTKIGRWVTASFNWINFAVNGSTKDYARIGGLPFTSTAYGAAVPSYNNIFQYNQNQGGWLSTGNTFVEFYRDGNSWNHWQSGGSRYLQVTVHYQAS